MLTLYFKPGCPFCNRVLAIVDQLDLEVEMKDVTADEAIAQELIDRSGSKEVPYMIDSDRNVDVDESDTIVEHLKQHYGTGDTATSVRVHRSGTDSTCISCEG